MLELESQAQHKLRLLLKGGVIEILGFLYMRAHARACTSAIFTRRMARPFVAFSSWMLSRTLLVLVADKKDC